MSESRKPDNILVKLFEKLQSADLSNVVFGKTKTEAVECSNCKTKFDWVKLPECKMGLVECPSCKWQVDQTGKAYEGKVPVNPAGKADDKLVKTLTEKPTQEGVVPANPSEVVDDKLIKALMEDIPGGSIQGDVPAGIPTSAATKTPLVPGNKTYAPANIAQNLPEEDISSYTVVAQGISVKDVADKIASVNSKRRIIPDKEDPKKFAVIEPITK